MVVFDYSDLAATAVRLIERFGKEVTIQRADDNTVDPAQPWKVTGSTPGATNTLLAAIVGIKQEDIDGTILKSGDQMALVAGPSLSSFQDVQTGDFITIDGLQYIVVRDPELIRPGNTTLLYKFPVRR